MDNVRVFSFPFHGDTIYLAETGGELYLPVLPLLLAMGLRPDVQHRKLTRHFQTGLRTFTLATDGEPESVLCLHARKLSGWLISLKPGSIRNREKIMLYQREFDDAVYTFSRTEQTGVTMPSRQDDPAEGLSMETFWFLYERLEMPGKPRLNHSSDPALTAIDPFDFRQYCEERGLKFPDIDTLRGELLNHARYAFAGFRVMKSPHTGKYVQCWLFRPRAPVEVNSPCNKPR